MPSAAVDLYIDALSEPGKSRLLEIRKFLHETLPEAEECFKWQMPTLYEYENLIHFACFKKHIGIFPGADGVQYFLTLREDYPTSKGTIQIAHDREIPWNDLKTLVLYRLKKAKEKSALKKGAYKKVKKA
ncbi:MAG: hypothetical protein RL577_592 [Bacteroidota bacterium]